MKEFLKYLGVFLVILGVISFVLYAFSSAPTNTYLIVGLSAVVVGIIAHVLLNKFIKD